MRIALRGVATDAEKINGGMKRRAHFTFAINNKADGGFASNKSW